MNIDATVFRDPNDLESVESWINEMQFLDDDPILNHVFDEEKKISS